MDVLQVIRDKGKQNGCKKNDNSKDFSRSRRKRYASWERNYFVFYILKSDSNSDKMYFIVE